MRRYGYTAIPVLNHEGKYLGCVTEGDFLRHVLEVGTTELKEHEKYRVGKIFRPDFCPALGIRPARPTSSIRCCGRTLSPSWTTGAVSAALCRTIKTDKTKKPLM